MPHSPVEKIMSGQVHSLPPDASISVATRLMTARRISLVVVAAEALPLGVVTEHDIVRLLLRPDGEGAGAPLRRVMSHPAQTIGRRTPVYDAYHMLATRGIRHLVVTEEDGSLAGVVTETDLMRHLDLEPFAEIRRVDTLMSRECAATSRGDLLGGALETMARSGTGCAVVLDDRAPVGILTERDVTRLFERFTAAELNATRVEELMRHPVVTVGREATINEAAALMRERRVRHLPVVDAGGRLAGLITQSDIARGIESRYIRALKRTIEACEKELAELNAQLTRLVDERTTALAETNRRLRYEAEERRRAEHALAEAQRLASLGSWTLDADAGRLYWSDEVFRIFGLRPGELEPTYRLLLEHVHPDDRNRLRARIAALLRRGERYELAHRLRTATGGSRHVIQRGEQMRDAGREGWFIGTVQDVTAQVTAEEELRRSHQTLVATLDDTIEAISTLAEARDPYTAGHQKRVAHLSCHIGRLLGLTDDHLTGIRLGGIIHDIGKIHVPAEILTKPARLTPIEFSIIKEHPRIGYDILSKVDFPWPVAEIALQHHERLDGSGYPHGIGADEILPEARIVAVSDVVESMSSHRPYREGMGIEAALGEIRSGRGTRYDPEVVDACIETVHDPGFSFEVDPVSD